jgi:translation initiation factor IF-3
MAKDEGKDLIEIAPKAEPPVVRIMEFGKFKYVQEKKDKEQKKKSKASEVKEVRFSPFIEEGDYQTRLRRVNKFLKGNDKVRVVIVFKGRHMNSKPYGYELTKRILNNLEHDIVIDMEPKFLGRHLAMVISPVKHKKKEDDKNKIKNKKERSQEV